MRSCLELPAGYRQTEYIHLKLDARRYRRLNGLSFLLCALLLALGWLLRSFEELKALLHGGLGLYYSRIALLLGLLWLSLLLRRAGQGLLLWAISGLPSEFRRAGLGLQVGNAACFSRAAWLLALLLPTAAVALLLALGALLLPGDWFWPLWGGLAAHLGGAVGDFYLALRALRLPAGALIRDEGYGTAFFQEDSQ